MLKTEINKYITEQVFEECWHKFRLVYKKWDEGKEESEICYKCSEDKPVEFKDFFTNEGCMELWLKIQKKDWFTSFLDSVNSPDYHWSNCHNLIIDTDIIHPDHLALAVYEFLNQ